MSDSKYRELWQRMDAVVERLTKQGRTTKADYYMIDFFMTFDDIEELERHIEIAEKIEA